MSVNIMNDFNLKAVLFLIKINKFAVYSVPKDLNIQYFSCIV